MSLNFLFQNGAEYVKKVKGIFCFKVKKGNDTGVFVVDVKNGNGSVKFDPNGKIIFVFKYRNAFFDYIVNLYKQDTFIQC